MQPDVQTPLFSHALFPVYIGLLVWGDFTCATSGCVPLFLCTGKGYDEYEYARRRLYQTTQTRT